MQLDRRAFIRLIAHTGLFAAGTSVSVSSHLRASTTASALSMRSATAGDAGSLQTIMSSCVRDSDAFFGKCGSWSLSWAADLITRCPDTVVLTTHGTPIAFLEIPAIRPELPPLRGFATDAEREQHTLRERNRTTFRATAAGIRDDFLEPAEAVAVFKKVLYYGFVTARRLGYQRVEALAPWDQHPRLARKWTDYPGCQLIEPVSRNQEGGHDVYWLRWTLDDAIVALADEGAAEDQLDVAK